MPGVRGVAISQPALLSGSVNSTSIYVQGRTYAGESRDRDGNSINRARRLTELSSNVMGIPVIAGRGLHRSRHPERTEGGRDQSRRRHASSFPNQNPLGQHFGSSLETSGQLEIVGVLRDAKYDSVRDAAPPTMYVP